MNPETGIQKMVEITAGIEKNQTSVEAELVEVRVAGT